MANKKVKVYTYKRTLGHLCMMGTESGCFSPDHERRFSYLLTPFTLVMANLLQNRRTLDFQRRCLEGKENLCGLELLREQRIVGEQGGLRETMDIVYQLSGREIPALIGGNGNGQGACRRRHSRGFTQKG